MDLPAILDDLDTLRLDELRQVQRRVNDLVDLIEGWQKPAENVVEQHSAPGGCYRLELVKCGKERCKKCSEGAGHGPYWYLYRYNGGKVKKSYIGKKRPE